MTDTPAPVAQPLSAKDIEDWREYAVKQRARSHLVVLQPDEFIAMLDRLDAARSVPDNAAPNHAMPGRGNETKVGSVHPLGVPDNAALREMEEKVDKALEEGAASEDWWNGAHAVIASIRYAAAPASPAGLDVERLTIVLYDWMPDGADVSVGFDGDAAHLTGGDLARYIFDRAAEYAALASPEEASREPATIRFDSSPVGLFHRPDEGEASR